MPQSLKISEDLFKKSSLDLSLSMTTSANGTKFIGSCWHLNQTFTYFKIFLIVSTVEYLSLSAHLLIRSSIGALINTIGLVISLRGVSKRMGDSMATRVFRNKMRYLKICQKIFFTILQRIISVRNFSSNGLSKTLFLRSPRLIWPSLWTIWGPKKLQTRQYSFVPMSKTWVIYQTYRFCHLIRIYNCPTMSG